MKVLVTGGHFSPAYTVVQQLKKEADVYIVGIRYALEGDPSESFEYEVYRELGIPFFSITTGRMQRRFTKHTVRSMAKFPLGLIHSLSIIKKVKPDVVLTFGGYVGLPVCIAAHIYGVPIIVHEQTQKAGLANKIISSFASCICISFESSRNYFPKDKIVLTGSPVRDEIFTTHKTLDIPKGYRIIYVTGGSTGSHFINDMMLKILRPLLERYIIIHQTGRSYEFRDFEKLVEAKQILPETLQKRYIVKEYFYAYEIGGIYKRTNLVLSRSGINTVCELLALSKVCLLIPLPHGQGGEQLENARLVKKIGIGEYLEQNHLTEDILFEKIVFMIENESIYTKNASQAHHYLIPNATRKIVSVVRSVYEQKTQAQA